MSYANSMPRREKYSLIKSISYGSMRGVQCTETAGKKGVRAVVQSQTVQSNVMI